MNESLSTASSELKIKKKPHIVSRIAWIDAARGFCIVLVVIGHAIGGLMGAGMVTQQSILGNINYFIYTFHIPAFFVISGMLAPSSVSKDPKKFLNNNFKYLLYPYLLYGTIQILIMNYFSNYLNTPIPFDPFEFLNLFIGSPSQFWFLKILFFVHVAYLISRKYSTDRWFLLLAIILRGCVELFALPAEISKFSQFVIFYALGAVFSGEVLNWPSRSRFPLVWAVVFGSFWILFAATSLSENDPILGGRLRGSLLPASIAGCLFIFALSGVKFIEYFKPLLYIGRNALAIFCLHVLFVAGSRIVFVKIFGASEVSLILPAVILAGIAGPLAFVQIAERFRLRAALGLGPN
jgi:fucose 4-O-acetylase-like acetyltransferase